jgi:tetratricopeptide (TPR) repeat protein
MSEASPANFEALTARWRRAVDDGALDEALRLADEALAEAQRTGDEALVQRAQCNRAQVAIELGQAESVLPMLRGLLTDSRELETRFHSAYALARAYDLKGDRTKARFYARIAQGHAVATGSAELVCWSFNLSGCLFLAESRFTEACEDFERALATHSRVPLREAALQDNLGYCYVVLGRHREALPLLYRSIWTLRRASGGLHRFPRLVLCYAHLELSNLDRAERHGRRALAAAEAHGDRELAKMALYLLGEVAKEMDDLALARTYFGLLQLRFYPDNPRLPDVLLQVDARQLVNLKA